MGYAQRANKIAQDAKNGLINSNNYDKRRLEELIRMGWFETAYKEGLINFNKLQELKTAKRHNDSI